MDVSWEKWANVVYLCYINRGVVVYDIIMTVEGMLRYIVLVIYDACLWYVLFHLMIDVMREYDTYIVVMIFIYL